MGDSVMMSSTRVVVFVGLMFGYAAAETVLVTGATGRTGSLAYAQLKEAGFDVKALVLNASKAASILHCGACTEKEGIFVGDVTDPATLTPAMANVTRLVITSASTPMCGLRYLGCKYPKGGMPKDVDWLGNKNLVLAVIAAGTQHVVLLSSMETTVPDNFLDKLGNGQVLFYKLNAEAFLMSSGLAFTIVKPGGLTMDKGGNQMFVGHEDQGFNGTSSKEIARADVAAVLTQACKMPALAANTRFDLVADTKTSATPDFKALFTSARQKI